MKPLHLIFLSCGLIVAGLYYSYTKRIPQREPLHIAEINTAGVVSMSLSPSVTRITPGPEMTVTLSADSSDKSLTAVAVELLFDASKLKITSVNPTTRLPTVLETPLVNDAEGRITFSFGAALDSHGVTGSGPIATLAVRARKAGFHDLSWGPGSLAAVLGVDENMLVSVTPLTINALREADLNADNVVNLFDYNIFVGCYGKAVDQEHGACDLNGDGAINLLDYNLFVGKYGTDYRTSI